MKNYEQRLLLWKLPTIHIDPFHRHVCTGNSDIIKDNNSGNMFNEGTKYRTHGKFKKQELKEVNRMIEELVNKILTKYKINRSVTEVIVNVL